MGWVFSHPGHIFMLGCACHSGMAVYMKNTCQWFVVYWKEIILSGGFTTDNGLLTSTSTELKDHSGLNIFLLLVVAEKNMGVYKDDDKSIECRGMNP
ncbi:MAG: hypothetical protein U9P49_14120 [Thermodesulfobacteriota bacterium]|nr:hypothetical protein [Thermodesulfobacteriota bacterium]